MMIKRYTPVALGLLLALSAGTAVAADKPYAPSNVTTTAQGELTTTQWQDPKRCKSCHPVQFEGWQGSMHSIAFIDPVFQAEWALGEKETNGATRNLCAGCHTPVGTITQTVSFDPSKGKHGGFETEGMAATGVSCDTCHTVSAHTMLDTPMLEHGNASIELTPGAKRGPLADSKSPMHKTVYSELHGKSEFCANCHNVFHPGSNFPIERTYDEWKYSPYAQNGVQCQDCHMVPVEVAIRVADEMKPVKELENHGLSGKAARSGKVVRDVVHNHSFVGGNAVIAPLLGVEGGEAHSAEAIKRLQSAASISTKVENGIGDLRTLHVTVHNNRAGHALPTSLTFIRQLWLEVVVRDANGNELLRSGTINADNELPEGTVIFQNKAVNANGEGPQHKPWEVYSFSEQNTIPPKGSRTANFAFNLPEGMAYSVETRLNYRSFSQGAATLLVGEKVRVPFVEMATEITSYNGAGDVVSTTTDVKAGLQPAK